MKIHTSTLIMTALGMALFASEGYSDEDQVLAGFERMLNHRPAATSPVTRDVVVDDLLYQTINAALWTKTDSTDQVLASFERDFNREPTQASSQVVSDEQDVLTEAFNSALWTVDIADEALQFAAASGENDD